MKKQKKAAKGRTTASRPVVHHPPREKEPEYVVAVSDPRGVRKELLETVREVIVFMQGYEKFRKIQEEKSAAIEQLKQDLRELNTLVDTRLRRYLPKGKLQAVQKVESTAVTEHPELPPVERSTEALIPEEKPEEDTAPELDDLEQQLNDIERQLQQM